MNKCVERVAIIHSSNEAIDEHLPACGGRSSSPGQAIAVQIRGVMRSLDKGHAATKKGLRAGSKSHQQYWLTICYPRWRDAARSNDEERVMAGWREFMDWLQPFLAPLGTSGAPMCPVYVAG